MIKREGVMENRNDDQETSGGEAMHGSRDRLIHLQKESLRRAIGLLDAATTDNRQGATVCVNKRDTIARPLRRIAGDE